MRRRSGQQSPCCVSRLATRMGSLTGTSTAGTCILGDARSPAATYFKVCPLMARCSETLPRPRVARSSDHEPQREPPASSQGAQRTKSPGFSSEALFFEGPGRQRTATRRSGHTGSRSLFTTRSIALLVVKFLPCHS